MGVQLTELLHRREITIDSLKDKKVAIDASNILYQFLSSIRQPDGTPLKDSQGNITSHLVGLSSRISSLMGKGLKICFVFDGKSPLLKIKEIEEREFKKRIAEEKLERAKEAGIEEDMYKYSMQTTRLTKEMKEEAIELIKALGLPVIQAPSEAEAQAAFMAEKNDVYAVISQDSDSLLFGAPRLIRNLTLSQRKRLPGGATVSIKPEMIELKEVLNSLEINHDQLIIMSILIGTDFNIGGVRGVGPKTALKLVKEYHNFNELFKNVKTDFNWKQVYAVFKSMPIMKNYQLKWADPNEKKIIELLVEKHDFSKERVEKIFENIGKRRVQSGLDKWF